MVARNKKRSCRGSKCFLSTHLQSPAMQCLNGKVRLQTPSDQERRKQFPEEKKDVGDTSSFLIGVHVEAFLNCHLETPDANLSVGDRKVFVKDLSCSSLLPRLLKILLSRTSIRRSPWRRRRVVQRQRKGNQEAPLPHSTCCQRLLSSKFLSHLQTS